MSQIIIQEENKFLHSIRICLIDGLFSYLFPKSNPNIRYCSDLYFFDQNRIALCSDLYSLMKCCRHTKRLFVDKFLRLVELKWTNIINWSKDRQNKLRR